MHKNEKNICKVCGLFQEEPPWGDDGNSPSFEICDCCGVEFGYEDSTTESIKRFRENWIASGVNWFNSKEKPDQWSLGEQLKNAVMRSNFYS